MYKKHVQIDTDTGEQQDGIAIWHPKKKTSPFGKLWLQMGQELMQAIPQLKLTAREHNVLWSLLAIVDFENYILIEQTKIAEATKLHTPDVSKAIKRLVALGILIQGPKVKRSATYRLNPKMGWKGDQKLHHLALREQRAEELARQRWGMTEETIDDKTVDMFTGKPHA